MLPPTIANLERLDGDVDVESALRSASMVPMPVRIEPRLRFDAGGEWIGLSMPGDDDYATLP